MAAQDGGVETEAARKRREARQNRATATAEKLADNMNTGIGVDGVAAQMILKGVTVGWLATALGMDHRTVISKLRECPPLKKKPGGQGYLYDLRTAAGFLVKPIFNVEDYMKQVKVEDLPIRFQEGFWGAQIKKQKWEEQAGELWRTQEVARRFSETFLMIKSKHDQWLDTLESRVEVTPEQRKGLESLVRDLQKTLITAVQDMERKVQPIKAEMPNDRPQHTPQVEDDDDFDISDVV